MEEPSLELLKSSEVSLMKYTVESQLVGMLRDLRSDV